jgi:HK97 family phage major capsid protein
MCAIALNEAAKLSNDVLLQGVIETILKDSPILQAMPFIEIVGNGLTYNREKTLPTAEWHAVNGDWTTSPTPDFDQLTAVLAILGQNADVDNYIKQTRSNIQDIEAAIIELTAKAVRHEFEDKFVYGDSSGGSNQFDGLRKLIDCTQAGAQVVTMGGTGATLTLAKLDELIDAVKGGKPDLLVMSRRSRRKVTALVRTSGAYMETVKGQFGDFIQLYNGIPIGINDWIKDTHTLASGYETAVTGGACSTIYAIQFGEGAVCGATNGGLQVEPIGSMEGKDAARTRIKWYVSLVDFCVQRRAALIGVTD